MILKLLHRDLGQSKTFEVFVGVGQWFRIVNEGFLILGNFGDDAGVIAGFAGVIAELSDVGGATAGFFQFGGRKPAAAGNGDVFKV